MCQPSFRRLQNLMRPFRGPSAFSSEQRVLFHSGSFTQPRRIITRTFTPWCHRPTLNCNQRFGQPSVTTLPFPISMTHIQGTTQFRMQHNVQLRSKRKSFIRTRFRPQRRRNQTVPKVTLNPSDPLNLQDLMKETERRRVEGLSPLRGDSRMNTPAVSVAGDIGGESPLSVHLPHLSKCPNTTDSTKFKEEITGKSASMILQNRPGRRSKCRNLNPATYYLPVTGNYRDYYSRRDPTDRLPYLMPEWFVGKDVADYGCHNGTLTFGVLERFPEVRKIDAFDCDVELIANARSMQRERLRWDTGSCVRYDKISFQVANWIDNSTCTDEPEYDTIMAFSVTKWIHLNHGDAGLMRFFRRAFNLLKPGGHLILEPQPKSSYRKTRFTSKQRSIYQSLKIDPSKLEPLLVDLGFSYFDTIKAPRPNEPFRRKIILCSKSYGATPASIRNGFRSEVQNWEDGFGWPNCVEGREPPPVCYYPQTPIYNFGTPASTIDSPANRNRQICPPGSVIIASPMPIASPEPSASSVTTPTCEPDSTTTA